MGFLRGLAWSLFAIVLITVAMYLTGNFALADYLTGVFLQVQPYLPMELSFDQFLVATTVASLLIVGLIVVGCTGLVLWMGARMSVAQQKQQGQAAAAERQTAHLSEKHLRQFEQLIALGQALTKKLDKRVLVQGIVEAASRLTSTSQTNAVVSCWLLDFASDTMRFEAGHYCDESFFAQSAYQLTDPPFAAVIPKQQTLLVPSWQEGLPILKPDKAGRLGAATGGLVIPLVVEGAVLGVLIIGCHPDVLKSYQEQRGFYNALWGELALALAVAVQGELAIVDRLTGVHNREYFMRRVIQELDRANRYQFPLSLLMVDIDNFKAVNDTLGHPQGDAVLRIISKIIRKETRAIDLVGRYGGEEFIILLPETGLGQEGTSASGALVVAERIRKAVEEEFQGMQKPLNLSVSVGLAVRRFPEDRGADLKEMIRLADEQLYRAKTTGKNKVCVHSPEPSAPAV
jgi:diguanylate cyclase (GGDEF)-like protein